MKMEQKNYDNETFDDFEDSGEFEIKPERYINNTILKIEEALGSTDNESKFRFFSLVQHLVSLASSSNLLTEETKAKIKELENVNFNSPMELFKNGNQKFQLVTTDLFANNRSETPLKI